MILQTIIPKVLIIIQRYPKVGKILTYTLALLSSFAAFTFGIKPLFEKLVWEWLPVIKISTGDRVYTHLRKLIKPKAKPYVLNEVLASSDNHTDYDDTTRSPRVEDEETEKELQWAETREMLFKNPSHRVFSHNGTFFWIESPKGGWGSLSKEQEISIRALSLSHRPIKSLLKDAWATHKIQRAALNTTDILEPENGRWIIQKNTIVRSLSTVDIEEKEKAQIIGDITKYLSKSNKKWYRTRGIPRRRGYLFHGPPGTGKSSLAAAIAGHFKTDIYSLSLTDSHINDSTLLNLVNRVPEGSVLLLEDVDSAGLTREQAGQEFKSPSLVTLSGLLNALDGAAAPEGHIVIMSTNTPEALDPAMVRAGRIDFRLKFKKAGKHAIASLFTRMMSDDDEEQIDKTLDSKAQDFAERIPKEVFAIAEIQGYLIDHARSPDTAIIEASEWVKTMLEKQVKDTNPDEKDAEAGQDLEAEKQKEEDEAREAKLSKKRKALEEFELETTEAELRAKKLQAEAIITKFQKKKRTAVVDLQAPVTPADSDDEQRKTDVGHGKAVAEQAESHKSNDSSD